MNSASSNKRALRITVDLDAIRHNLNVAKQRSTTQKLFAVVKADAYGHGAVPVARALDGADAFAVVTLHEALELRDAGIEKPVLVLQGAFSQFEYAAFAQHRLWPVIHCEEQLQWFVDETSIDTAALQPWIKIDTGMGRLGFLPDRAQELLSDAVSLDWFGALTHFASADETENASTAQQINLFNSLNMSSAVQRSLANSAGLIAWPQAQSDWARPGIMLYGSNPVLGDEETAVGLRAVMRVSAPIISTKAYSAGACIGYAASYQCPKPMTIGYVGIGYGDGLPRVLDHSATVWIAGKRCPVLGRVSMDSIAVDLEAVKSSVGVGTEVVLWGPEHPVELLAAAANTISYELLTSIRGPRVYTDNTFR